MHQCRLIRWRSLSDPGKKKDGNKENEGKEEGEEKGRKGMNLELHIHGNFQNRRL